LANERKRLARGVVTGTLPGNLAREEHDRIAHELEQAGRTLAAAQMIYARIEDTLNRALALVGRGDEGLPAGRPAGPPPVQPVLLREAAHLRGH